MKKFITIFLFLVLLRSCAGFKKTLPVFMIDHDAVMSRKNIRANPFEITSSDFLTELALEAIKRTECIIIFIEETLCTEDLSAKDHLGTTFYNLEKGIMDKKVVYMPSVNEPYDLLRQIFEPQVSNVFHLGNGESLKLLNQHKYIYVYFEDDDEVRSDRFEELRKHDILMKEVYFTVRQMKLGPVLAFYTGKKNPVTVAQLRYTPHVDQRTAEDTVLVETPEALFQLTGIFYPMGTRRSSIEDTPLVEYEMRTHDGLTTTMLVADFHLQFNFEFEEKNWHLANIAMLEAGEEVGRTLTDIKAPWQRSYYCSEPITIINKRDGSYITISEYQIEPLTAQRRFYEANADNLMIYPRTSDDNSTNSTNSTNETMIPGRCYFSKSKDCGPYFNTAILSGLFVFTIFLSIIFWAVIMIFNIGTNDRFDDPNQKPLVITTEDRYAY